MLDVTRWVAFVSVGAGGCQPGDPFVCFGAKPTKMACVWDFLRDRKKTRRRHKWELGSRQERAVNRSQGNSTVRKGWLQWPVDAEAGLANVRRWVSISGGFVGISLEYTLSIAHRCTENYAKVSQISPFLRLDQTQVCNCLFFFSSSLSVVYIVFCVFLKNVKYPWPERRETTRRSDGHEWFRMLR